LLVAQEVDNQGTDPFVVLGDEHDVPVTLHLATPPRIRGVGQQVSCR
jgi:hypothetical protein